MRIPAVAFSAFSGTGKTTLIEKLIAEFRRRGLSVAAVKHDGHDFEMDREGKDTWRFAAAGAETVVISSKSKTARIEKRGRSLEELLFSLGDADIVLVEGWKDSPLLPRIGIGRQATGKGFTAPIESLAAIVTDMEVESEKPRFALDDITGIADFIMEITKERDMDFTHFNEEGRAKMVDVGDKAPAARSATAAARVLVSRETFELIRSGGMKKGDVLTVAQIAGVMGAKRTPELIPMCHPILIDGVDLKLSLDESRCSVEIEATVKCFGRTGVEMEALTAASTAALTVYDMCKAVQKDMVISELRLLEKTGGVHGDFRREE